MSRLCRASVCLLALGVMAASAGCQAKQMVNHYMSFDSLVTDLYEKHVLTNLARRDNGRTMVQMDYRGFSANLNTSFGTSGKVQFFTNPEAEATDGTSISLNMFRQSFEPNINSSTGTGLSINSGPADNQEAIRAMYDEQVNRSQDSRVFRRTGSRLVAMRGYCWIRTAEGEIYYVPQEKHREFADFVHKVSFYKPAPPVSQTTTPPAPPPASAAATQPAGPATQAAATAPSSPRPPAGLDPFE